jgi:antitoxin ParD1/3/4
MCGKHEIAKSEKRDALRVAARVGFEALDRGEFKEFANITDLEAYLHDFGEGVISSSYK